MTRIEHRSGGSDSWETPSEVFEPLNEEFGFTLDVCASHENAKCDVYMTEEGGFVYDHGTYGQFRKEDGLSTPWTGYTCWCNPPYSEWQEWVRKAWNETQNGVTTVMLLPARTDTKAFHNYIWQKPNVEIRFIKGRVRFVGAKHGAPFPSMIVVFRPPSETLVERDSLSLDG